MPLKPTYLRSMIYLYSARSVGRRWRRLRIHPRARERPGGLSNPMLFGVASVHIILTFIIEQPSPHKVSGG